MPLTPLKFGQQQKLTTRLRELVSEYPRGVGIFKEFLQNADDAGASLLELYLDQRSFDRTGLPNAKMGSLMGRSLVFVNDTAFSETDWEKIQDIGNSGKAMDTAKTGRFGLGFNCVYNVTDFPMLLTRDRLGIFDPHAQTVESATIETPGAAWELSELWEKHPNLLAPFRNYGLEERQEFFDGTIFRFPLRNQAMAEQSQICEQPFNSKDFRDVVESVQKHGGELLLFLNSVQQFKITEINREGESNRTLRIATANTKEVTAVQEKIRNELSRTTDSLLTIAEFMGDQTWFGEHKIKVEIGGSVSTENWWKVRGLFGHEELISSAREMNKLKKKAIPLAGAAVRLDSSQRVGGLSCSLPLPTDSNTPINVDGFFDIHSNRQDIFQDAGSTGVDKARCDWNRKLLQHGCAIAVAQLLKKTADETGAPIYEKWPSVPVDDDWLEQRQERFVRELPRYIYEAVKDLDCIAVDGEDSFVAPRDAKVTTSKISEILEGEGLSIACPIPPSHVVQGLELIDAAIPSLTPENVRDFLRDPDFADCELEDAPFTCLQNRDSVLALLKFCLKDKDANDFEGVPLALMSDELLRKFDSQESKGLFLGEENERNLLAGVVDLFLNEDVVSLGVELLPNVRSISINDVIENAAELYRSVGDSGFVSFDSAAENIPSYEWLAEFFDYCAAVAKEDGLSALPAQEFLRCLPLVPDSSGRLWGMCLKETPVFVPTRHRKPWLVGVLQSAGKSVVTDADRPGKAIARFKAAIGSDEEIDSVTPEKLVELASEDPETYEALLTSDDSTNGSFLDFVSASQAGQISWFVRELKSLTVFPVKGGGFTSIVDGVYQSSGFQAPEVSAEFTILNDGNGRWSKLYDLLAVEKLTQTSFVTDFVLEDFSNISTDDQFTALEWLRANYHFILNDFSDEAAKRNFKRKLRAAKIIRCEDGELHAPQDLYHPDCKELVKLLGSAANFPDQELFFDEEWMHFLVKLGMVSSARPRDVIKAIDNLIESPFTHRIADKLGTLAKFITDNWEMLYDDSILSEWFAGELAKRAWLPAISKRPSGIPDSLFEPPTVSLFKPSAIARRRDLDLVCSVLPVCMFKVEDAVGKVIGHVGPSVETVLSHFDNLIESMDAKKSANKAEERLLEKIYQYIGRALNKREPEITAQELSQTYHNVYCLIDRGNRLWAPLDTFETPVPFFLDRRRYIKFSGADEERCMTALGRKTSPTTDDFQEFFEELAAELGQDPFATGELELVRDAYRAVAKISHANEMKSSPVLSEDGHFCKSSVVLFFDAPWLEKRVAESVIELADRELGLSVATAFGVGRLSEVVSERIASHKTSDDETLLAICRQFNKTVASSEFTNGMLRLLPPEFVADEVVRRLQDFKVIAASEITTELYRGEDAVDDSLGHSDFVFDEGAAYVTSLNEAILRVKVAETISEQLFAGVDVSALKISMMFSDIPANIELLLDQLHVAKLPVERAVQIPSEDESEVRQSQQLLSDEFDDETTEESAAPLNGANPKTRGNATGVQQGTGSNSNWSGGSSSNGASSGSGRTEADFPKVRKGKGRRRAGNRTRTGRAVSYVGGGEIKTPTAPTSGQFDNPIHNSAVEFVLKEENLVQSACKSAESNSRIDIESKSKPDGDVERLITVVGLPGAWGESGIRLTPAQLAFGQENGDKHWLYVVEFANEPKRSCVHVFQNPAKLITEYRLDSGWTQLATETLGAGTVPPKQGSRVSIAESGEGEIISIKEFKAFKKLKIQLDSGEPTEIKYPHPTVTILD